MEWAVDSVTNIRHGLQSSITTIKTVYAIKHMAYNRLNTGVTLTIDLNPVTTLTLVYVWIGGWVWRRAGHGGCGKYYLACLTSCFLFICWKPVGGLWRKSYLFLGWMAKCVSTKSDGYSEMS